MMVSKFKIYVISLFLGLNSFIVQSYACDETSIEKALAELVYPEFAKAYAHLKSIDTNVFSGKANPTWNDFNNADLALQALKKQKAVLPKSQIREVLKKVGSLIKNDPRFSERQLALQEVVLEPEQVEKLDLKVLFFDMLHEINKQLPRSARFAIKTQARAERHAALAKEAKEIVARLSAETKARFAKTSYETPEAVVSAIRNRGSENDELIDMVMNEKVEFTMLRPSRGRWWIQRLGFQNQRVTGSSKGTFDNRWRDQAEAEQSLSDLADYKKKSAELKPNYGYLRPPLNSDLKTAYPTQYGDDLYVFDKDKLQGRVTWTFADSLGGRSGNNESWQKLMTPWQERELLLPYLMEKFKTQAFHPSSSSLLDFSGRASRYVELQYWGPVDLSYVKKFVYFNNPPDDDFKAALEAHGIEIIDGRAGKIAEQNDQSLW